MLRSDKTARMAATAALKSADTAEKDLLASHRPLITVTNLKLRHPDEPNGQYRIAFGLRNSGKGFAAVNKIGVTIQTVDSNGTQQVRFVSAEWHGAIEAGDLMDGNSVATEILGQNEHYLVINGRMALFVNFEVSRWTYSTTKSVRYFLSSTISGRPISSALPLNGGKRQRLPNRIVATVWLACRVLRAFAPACRMQYSAERSFSLLSSRGYSPL